MISEAGQILTGVYSETLAGLTPEPMERVGTFRVERPARQLVAGFTAHPVSGGVPLTVDFEDLSLGDPTDWAWDLSDGGTSAAQHPSHVYDQVGS